MARPSLAAHLHPWAGPAYRHIPDGAYNVLDFRFAGLGQDNRWNRAGEPTLYLAGDRGVAIAEFSRHYAEVRVPRLALHTQRRQLYRLEVRLEQVLDLRQPEVRRALALPDSLTVFLNREIARAAADLIRAATATQAILVPSIAFLDQVDRWVLALFLEKLPADPSAFIAGSEPDSVLEIGQRGGGVPSA